MGHHTAQLTVDATAIHHRVHLPQQRHHFQTIAKDQAAVANALFFDNH